MNLNVNKSDLEKILDVLKQNEDFHRHRDAMNARLHLGEPRYCPLCYETIAARERLEAILKQSESGEGVINGSTNKI